MAVRWDRLSPLDPRLLELLQKLDSETELALRVALEPSLMEVPELPDHRIIELRKAVVRNSDSLDRVLRRSEVFEHELRTLD
jgi:hypothetical protein